MGTRQYKATISVEATQPDGTKQVLVLEDCLVSDVMFSRGGPTETFGPPLVPVVTITFNPTEYPQWTDVGVPVLEWYYGPTATHPDPGRMWHDTCNGEVLSFDGGLICQRCKMQGTLDA